MPMSVVTATVGLTDADGWADEFIEGWEEGTIETEGLKEGMADATAEGGSEDGTLDDFVFINIAFADLLSDSKVGS